ncbi:SDR family oxidoreductase [Aromatoleum toluolicum]|uniref:SDR family oxidoreductase n=1 Tax=Aromatoleum toluolicum TaxID=90060 RepID=A0ABX1NM31_9RHOO|nr:SDR family oxidoreductase [Aromatoleum toluolicum]NMG00101.1 SDR family oxidoreductase [Aromatoleum toluolicum]
MGRLNDKVVLVTGGASGVGREDVLLMAREGATVVLTDCNVDAGEALAKEVGDHAMFLRHDVSSEADWQAVMAAVEARFGRLDAVVNNAGILESASLEEATLEHWQRIQRINADSCFLGCKYGVLALKERGGSIVNMASVSSWLPVDGYAAYSASKAAVGAVTRAAALHCRKRGYSVRVNSVHPDGIYTPMMQASAPGVDPKYMLFDPARNRGGRACMPNEIANVVLFLVSDESRFVSGAEIRVDNAILGMGL